MHYYKPSASLDEVLSIEPNFGYDFRRLKQYGLRWMLVLPRRNQVIVKKCWGKRTDVETYYADYNDAFEELKSRKFRQQEEELDQICVELAKLYNRLYEIRKERAKHEPEKLCNRCGCSDEDS